MSWHISILLPVAFCICGGNLKSPTFCPVSHFVHLGMHWQGNSTSNEVSTRKVRSSCLLQKSAGGPYLRRTSCDLRHCSNLCPKRYASQFHLKQLRHNVQLYLCSQAPSPGGKKGGKAKGKALCGTCKDLRVVQHSRVFVCGWSFFFVLRCFQTFLFLVPSFSASLLFPASLLLRFSAFPCLHASLNQL